MVKSIKPTTCIIVAIAQNRVIGNKGQLPWHLPADLKHFKAITTGHPIIMGRKTYLSIGRPLPNRTNIIITRDPAFRADGCVVVHSTDDALVEAARYDSSEIFIIGGAEIYEALLPKVNKIYLTMVEKEVAGDAYFPALNEAEWQTISEEKHPDCRFLVMTRSRVD